VPDLAVLTTAEVQNFLSEGSSGELDPSVMFQLDRRQTPAVAVESQQLHVDDGTASNRAAAVLPPGENPTAVDGTTDVAAGVLQRTIERLVFEHLQKGKSAAASSPFAALCAVLGGGAAKLCATAALQILRGLFYEAQVREDCASALVQGRD
jgi:hypothetical protein